MMKMADHVAINVETLRIDSGCSMEKEFTELTYMNPWMVIIPNCQSGLLMSWLFMWSLRHQRHLLGGWSCFYYNLWIPNHGYLKHHVLDITWRPQRWLCDQDGIIHPRYLKRLTQGMRCDKILCQSSGNIRENFFDNFLHTLVITWVTD